jgi:glucose/arabinose dehydrogenase/elongation factor P hydroxylase
MKIAICCLVLATISVSGLQAGTAPGLDAVQVASGLTRPLFVTAPPGDSGRLFIVQQDGNIRILNLLTGTLNPAPFLTLTGLTDTTGEQGLLGMAFDPNYATNGKFYLNFTVPGGAFGNGVTHVSQFSVRGNPDIADPNSERILITFDHPESNHNGGWIGFSPRTGDANNLYIATGDGGAGNDQGTGHIEPGGNAQNLTTLLGKMLRIHVDSAAGTATIPSNNPFVGMSGARGEIWAFGLRNPFRNSFDRQTGRMFIGDVGQDTREEIDVQQATNAGGGENYGWRVREGSIQNPAFPGSPTPPGAIDPIFDYSHSVGQTIIGGYVYRGNRIPDLRGVYVFGDYSAGQIFSFDYDGSTVSNFQTITSQLFPTSVGGFTLSHPSSLGEDANGELYITDIGNGSVFKIVSSAGWSVVGVADFNRDGHPDYLLFNSSTRQTAIWYLNNNVFSSGLFGPTLPAGWSVVGVADFNGDGHPDYLLFNSSTRQTAIWYLNNNVLMSGLNGPTLPVGWTVVGVADFNGDGHPDYLLFNSSTRRTAIWYLNNNVFSSGLYGPTLPAGWSVVGVADFNGDGHLDYLLFNSSTRQTAIWYLNNNVLSSGLYGPTLPVGWTVMGVADFNGDGHPDYLLYNGSTQRTVIWYLNNNIRSSGLFGPALPAG